MRGVGTRLPRYSLSSDLSRLILNFVRQRARHGSCAPHRGAEIRGIPSHDGVKRAEYSILTLHENPREPPKADRGRSGRRQSEGPKVPRQRKHTAMAL